MIADCDRLFRDSLMLLKARRTRAVLEGHQEPQDKLDMATQAALLLQHVPLSSRSVPTNSC